MRDLARDFRLLTSPLRLVPDFAIVGEAKCGTTSLYRYLLQSPAVLGADRKEPKNFIDYPDSLFYCRSHYPTRAARRMRRMRLGRRVVAGEATAEYFSHPGMAERLLRLLPRIKIVVLLRNPVDRAYSDYQMLSRLGATDLSFDEVVDRSLEWLETPALSDLVDAALRNEHFYLRFVARGLYVRTLRQWFDVLPAYRILVLRSEDLFERPADVVADVCRFLEVEPFVVRDATPRRAGSYDSDMGNEPRRRLEDFYRPYNRELYALVNRNMNWEVEAQ
jgi:hypothetical protein